MKAVLKTFVLLVLSIPLCAQEHEVKGTVTSSEDGNPLPGVNVNFIGSNLGVVTDLNGKYSITVPDKYGKIVFSFIGLQTKEVKINGRKIIDVELNNDVTQLSEVVVSGVAAGIRIRGRASMNAEKRMSSQAIFYDEEKVAFNNEEYDAIHENQFVSPVDHPLSTFSIDVDNASYSNLRRFLNNGQKPPIDAVRIEEMVNYFDYEYADPIGEHPFAVYTELSGAPWNSENMLLKVSLQGKRIPEEQIPKSNLVFLIDVSGSMNSANKLPLLKESFMLLVSQLRPQDKVAIVVYAGAAGVVLPSTQGNNKEKIIEALNRLNAGGSTAGGAGIKLAYDIAKESFIEGGNNRIILATDGDFNVGVSSNAAMERLITKKREEGVFLTVLGYGMGNYKDSKMEILANKGNGNYAYIDNLREAQKVLVDEMTGTLLTIAKDVKLQLEFNPQHVKAYRLIGYENRMLNEEDFNDDKKDAGEMGAGHTVTALYEIVPAEGNFKGSKTDPLKYQDQKIIKSSNSNELLTLKMRYKEPDGNKSIKIEQVVYKEKVDFPNTTENFQWATAVAGYGMWLRESEFIKDYSIDEILEIASGARGTDEHGYRIEFINMVKSTRLLARE